MVYSGCIEERKRVTVNDEDGNETDADSKSDVDSP